MQILFESELERTIWKYTCFKDRSETQAQLMGISPIFELQRTRSTFQRSYWTKSQIFRTSSDLQQDLYCGSPDAYSYQLAASLNIVTECFGSWVFHFLNNHLHSTGFMALLRLIGYCQEVELQKWSLAGFLDTHLGDFQEIAKQAIVLLQTAECRISLSTFHVFLIILGTRACPCLCLQDLSCRLDVDILESSSQRFNSRVVGLKCAILMDGGCTGTTSNTGFTEVLQGSWRCICHKKIIATITNPRMQRWTHDFCGAHNFIIENFNST